MTSQLYFETLNEALESEGLVSQWPLGFNVSYATTERVVTEGNRCIVVTRDNRGLYERPVHYSTH